MSEPTFPFPATSEFDRPVEVFVVHPPRPHYWLHVLLLLATIFTTLVVGARMEFNFLHDHPALYTGDDGLSIFPLTWALRSRHLVLGVPFSLTLMLILMAHEMGHYLYCRHYGVWATLPFFIPFPTLIGTLGAFIRIRSPIRSRAALFDIGIAGPIAGFAVAVPVLFLSLGLSRPAFPSFNATDIELGYPLIFDLARHLLAALAGSHSVAALPFSHVHLHPTAIAAWVGMFATALNLLPGGQLDGGHIVFALAPRAHRFVSRLTILALAGMAVFLCYTWLVWAMLLAVTGMRHPIVPERPAVTGSRRGWAALALLMLILTLAPMPFAHTSLLDLLRELRSP